jgi:acetyl-CoA carboxylase biotin carboxyl carrier protein
MKTVAPDGRVFAPQLTAKIVVTDTGVDVLAPAVGLWRDAPIPGARVIPGQPIGSLEILGVVHRVLAPAGAQGVVRETAGPRLARRAVAYGECLLALEPLGSLGTGPATAAATGPAGTDDQAALRFPSPLSGRYYARPAPDQPAFVTVGDVVTQGQTIALLEVMKTFNRLTYGGEGVPDRARVVAIVPADGDDVDEGDTLLQLEPA